MKVGDLVRLKGITRKGKQRVQRDGSWWWVARETDAAQCFDGAAAWRLTPAIESELFGGAARWIRKVNDSDFEVVEVDGE